MLNLLKGNGLANQKMFQMVKLTCGEHGSLLRISRRSKQNAGAQSGCNHDSAIISLGVVFVFLFFLIYGKYFPVNKERGKTVERNGQGLLQRACDIKTEVVGVQSGNQSSNFMVGSTARWPGTWPWALESSKKLCIDRIYTGLIKMNSLFFFQSKMVGFF